MVPKWSTDGDSIQVANGPCITIFPVYFVSNCLVCPNTSNIFLLLGYIRYCAFMTQSQIAHKVLWIWGLFDRWYEVVLGSTARWHAYGDFPRKLRRVSKTGHCLFKSGENEWTLGTWFRVSIDSLVKYLAQSEKISPTTWSERYWWDQYQQFPLFAFVLDTIAASSVSRILQ